MSSVSLPVRPVGLAWTEPVRAPQFLCAFPSAANNNLDQRSTGERVRALSPVFIRKLLNSSPFVPSDSKPTSRDSF